MVSYAVTEFLKVRGQSGLNPYCSGRWSRTHAFGTVELSNAKVLILIVVEDGLVQNENGNEDKAKQQS